MLEGRMENINAEQFWDVTGQNNHPWSQTSKQPCIFDKKILCIQVWSLCIMHLIIYSKHWGW